MNQTAATSPNTPISAADVLDAPSSPTPSTDGASKLAPPADDKISPKLQVLIQREKTALERERAAKAKESELEAKLASFSERESRLSKFENLKQTNPLGALEMLGLSYQELTQIALADGNVTPDIELKRVDAKYENRFKALEEKERLQAEEAKKREAEQNERTITKFKSEIASYLKENASRYELIEFEQIHDLVYETIDENYNRTLEAATKAAIEAGEDTSEIRGEVMSIAQAADKIEKHLEEKYDKARNLNKVKTLLAPRQEKPPVKPPTNPTRHTPQTLTNNLSATQSAVARKTPVTDDERVARAIAYARNLRPQA